MNDKFLRIIKKLGVKNKSFLEKKLPKMFFFTDRNRVDDVFAVVKNLPKNSAIIIREYDLENSQRLDFARIISDLARKRSLKVFVGKDIKLAKKIKADGVHFSDWEGLKSYNNLGKNFLISYACHSEKSVRRAQKIGCDLIFYSPIFPTKSHPNQKTIGSLKLRNLTAKATIPIYALGGIDGNNAKILVSSGVGGVGGVSIFQDNILRKI